MTKIPKAQQEILDWKREGNYLALLEKSRDHLHAYFRLSPFNPHLRWLDLLLNEAIELVGGQYKPFGDDAVWRNK